MARLFLMDTGNFAVWNELLNGNESDPVNWTKLATYDETLHPAKHQLLSDSVKRASWNAQTQELTINGVVEIDSTWIAARLAEVNQAVAVASAKSGLKDKITLAQAHADTIKVLFNAVLDQTINQTTQPTRFTNLQSIVTGAAQGFRDRVVTDIQQELGFDVTSGSLTAAQQRQATLYMRAWVTGLVLLLTQA